MIASRIQPARGGDLTPTAAVLAEGVTNGQGRYRLSLVAVSSKTHRCANVIANKEGTGIAWQQLNLDTDSAGVSLELPPEEPVTGQLVDSKGQPAAAVRLRVQAVARKAVNGGPIRASVDYRTGSNIPVAWPQPTTTDQQGRFTLRGIPLGYGVFFHVMGNDRFAPQSIALNTGVPEQRGEQDGTYRPMVKNVEAGVAAVLPLAPAQPFEGVVTYEDTGQPAPHARLTIWAGQEELGSMFSVAGTADSEGRYYISPNPGLFFGVTAYPPDGVPYLARGTPPETAIRWQAGDTLHQVNVALPRGVLVRGGCMSAFAGAKGSGKTSIGELTDCRLEWELYGCLVSFQGGSHGGETGSTGRKT